VSIALLLAHATDAGAASVAAWLAREVGPGRVRMIRPEALSLASWTHEIDAHGRSSTRIVFRNVEPLASAEVGAVLNRIRYLPMPGFNRASAKDRDYATAELQAVVASWLAGFGSRAIHSLWRHPWITPMLPLQHWAAAAAACGLPVASRTIASSSRLRDRDHEAANPAAGTATGTVLVAGENLGGALAAPYGEQCLAAARLLGFSLLEFRFHGADLVQVDPLPALAEPWAAALTGRLLRSLLRENRA